MVFGSADTYYITSCVVNKLPNIGMQAWEMFR